MSETRMRGEIPYHPLYHFQPHYCDVCGAKRIPFGEKWPNGFDEMTGEQKFFQETRCFKNPCHQDHDGEFYYGGFWKWLVFRLTNSPSRVQYKCNRCGEVYREYYPDF